MSYSFKYETEDLYSINGSEPTSRIVEVEFSAYWNRRRKEMVVEGPDSLTDMDTGKDLSIPWAVNWLTKAPLVYPDAPYVLTERDLQGIVEDCEEKAGNEFACAIEEDSAGRDIDRAMDLLGDR